jgi:hypothetical protein
MLTAGSRGCVVKVTAACVAMRDRKPIKSLFYLESFWNGMGTMPAVSQQDGSTLPPSDAHIRARFSSPPMRRLKSLGWQSLRSTTSSSRAARPRSPVCSSSSTRYGTDTYREMRRFRHIPSIHVTGRSREKESASRAPGVSPLCAMHVVPCHPGAAVLLQTTVRKDRKCVVCRPRRWLVPYERTPESPSPRSSLTTGTPRLRITWLRTRLWRAEPHSRRRFSTATVCPTLFTRAVLCAVFSFQYRQPLLARAAHTKDNEGQVEAHVLQASIGLEDAQGNFVTVCVGVYWLERRFCLAGRQSIGCRVEVA